MKDDTISRQGLKESLLSEDYEKHEYCFPCKEIMKRIDEQPSAQPEPCEDAVSRQAAIDEIEERKNANGYRNVAVISELNRLEGYIMRLPSAQPEQRWIPCSERLPMSRDWYLGIFKEPDTGWINPIPYVCDYVSAITSATTYEGWILHHCTDQDMPCEYYKELQCVAWMPLPEPYRGEGDS